MGRRQGRPRAGTEPLTRDIILEKALSLVDAGGLEALSMRRLAETLDVDPMALYHHFPGKRALLSALLAKVFGGLSVPRLPGASWKAKVRAYTRSYRNLAHAHPKLILQLVSDAEAAGKAAMEAGESLYAALRSAGLSPIEVVRSADLIVDYMHGALLGEAETETETEMDAGAAAGARNRFRALLREQGAGRLPAMERTYRDLPGRMPATGFDSGLDIILLGIEALRSRKRGRSA